MVSVVALALLAPSAAWYVDPDCMKTANLVYSAHIDEAKARIAELSASKDLDDQACALWVSATMKEMEIALFDDADHLWAEMQADLDAMEKFGREHGNELRFADLVLEAEFRRVRVFAEQEEKMDAMRAARRAQTLLEERREKKKGSPSYFYAEALINLAITHADWHVRAACALLGMRGDGKRGKKAMALLLKNKSVYQSEAMVVARSFTVRVPGLFDEPLIYSAKLRKKHPDNPQLAFDHAIDLGKIERCEEAMATLQSVLPKAPTYSKNVQAKLTRAQAACN